MRSGDLSPQIRDCIISHSPFNLDRTLFAVFLMSAVRSSSSCLVSAGEGKQGSENLDGALAPESP